jgi:hypothetical protein
LVSVATIDDARHVAMALPEVAETTSYGNRAWAVRGKKFAWERPYSKADRKRFGSETPPPEPILAVIVDDLAEKEAVLVAGTCGVFTIAHFDGFAAVLIELEAITDDDLRTALLDGWLAAAPRALAALYLKEH